MKYKVGIIGCGGIFPRHIEAIEANEEFELKAICDIQKTLVESLGKRYKVSSYIDYKEMILMEDLNFIVIATPNSLHKEQSIFALENQCDVLIEKPATFSQKDLNEILKIAKKCNQKSYCVLQVRLNPTVSLAKEILNRNLLGNIRGFSFTQRWQRPLEYFSGWRGEPDVGGGILYETGIHYLDILQYLIGNPKKILSTKTYTTKHKEAIIEDTIYSLVDYGNFGGTIESTIAAEPHNIESSITLMGSNGYIKIGGKALNVIESANFLSNGCTLQYEDLQKQYSYSKDPNSYGSYQGSCPNHPEVYRNLEKFNLEETNNVIILIEEIYKKANIKYGNNQ
jgi:predicted dehydrogenase|tara:strand:+ start:5880 stop:6896 length:1017 start_codon:yes stop_codon:yes gene_type:complete